VTLKCRRINAIRSSVDRQRDRAVAGASEHILRLTANRYDFSAYHFVDPTIEGRSRQSLAVRKTKRFDACRRSIAGRMKKQTETTESWWKVLVHAPSHLLKHCPHSFASRTSIVAERGPAAKKRRRDEILIRHDDP